MFVTNGCCELMISGCFNFALVYRDLVESKTILNVNLRKFSFLIFWCCIDLYWGSMENYDNHRPATALVTYWLLPKWAMWLTDILFYITTVFCSFRIKLNQRKRGLIHIYKLKIININVHCQSCTCILYVIIT